MHVACLTDYLICEIMCSNWEYEEFKSIICLRQKKESKDSNLLSLRKRMDSSLKNARLGSNDEIYSTKRRWTTFNQGHELRLNKEDHKNQD